MIENALKQSAPSSAGEIMEMPYLRVVFQKGFPRDVGINGVRVQDVIQVAIDRIKTYQDGPLACSENEIALQAMQHACNVLDERERRRQEQGVFHTMRPHEYVRTEDEIDDFSATGG